MITLTLISIDWYWPNYQCQKQFGFEKEAENFTQVGTMRLQVKWTNSFQLLISWKIKVSNIGLIDTASLHINHLNKIATNWPGAVTHTYNSLGGPRWEDCKKPGVWDQHGNIVRPHRHKNNFKLKKIILNILYLTKNIFKCWKPDRYLALNWGK